MLLCILNFSSWDKVRRATTYKTRGFATLYTIIIIAAYKRKTRNPKTLDTIMMMGRNEITLFPCVGLELSHPRPVLTWNFIFIDFQQCVNYLSVLMTLDKKIMLRRMTRRTGIPRNQEWPWKSSHIFGYLDVLGLLLVYIWINSSIFLYINSFAPWKSTQHSELFFSYQKIAHQFMRDV